MKKKNVLKIVIVFCLVSCVSALTGCVSEEQMQQWAEDLYDQNHEDELEEELTPSEISATTKAKVQEIVDEIIKPEMSELEKAVMIHDWLTVHLDFDHSHTNYHAAEALDSGISECQGYAECFELMAELAGLETTLVRGICSDVNGESRPHSWNQVKIDGVWYNADVTLDDPSNNKNKKADDHSKNCYKYFLISKDEFHKTHIAKEYYEGEKTCNTTYDREGVLKCAAANGAYGDVAFVKNKDDLNTCIKNAMGADKDALVVWLYDSSALNEHAASYIQELIKKLDCYVSPSDTFSCSLDGVIKFSISFYKGSEWKEIPVVKDETEFKTLLETMGRNGEKTYVVRYEVTEGEPVIPSSQYGCKMKYITYNDGKSWLITVSINN